MQFQFVCEKFVPLFNAVFVIAMLDLISIVLLASFLIKLPNS